MRSFIILENIFLFFISSSTSNTYFTFCAFLYQSLSFSFRSNYSSNIICLRVVHCRFCQINLLVFFEWLKILRGNESFSHFHAILNETNSLSMQCISFSYLSCVYSATIFIVDGFGTWRSDVRIIRSKIINFSSEFIKSVESKQILNLIESYVWWNIVYHWRCECFFDFVMPL